MLLELVHLLLETLLHVGEARVPLHATGLLELVELSLKGVAYVARSGPGPGMAELVERYAGEADEQRLLARAKPTLTTGPAIGSRGGPDAGAPGRALAAVGPGAERPGRIDELCAAGVGDPHLPGVGPDGELGREGDLRVLRREGLVELFVD